MGFRRTTLTACVAHGLDVLRTGLYQGLLTHHHAGGGKSLYAGIDGALWMTTTGITNPATTALRADYEGLITPSVTRLGIGIGPQATR